MSTHDWLAGHDHELTTALADLRRHGPDLDRWAGDLLDVLEAGGRLLAAGNGGSAAEAQHLTAELVGRFRRDRRAFSAISLCVESSSVTAIVNDYGADEVFARQVEAHGRPGDVLVLLSTSGASSNVLRAADRARELGVRVWALTGRGPNPLAERADRAVCVPAGGAVAQAVHLVAIHALCEELDVRLAARGGEVTEVVRDGAAPGTTASADRAPAAAGSVPDAPAAGAPVADAPAAGAPAAGAPVPDATAAGAPPSTSVVPGPGAAPREAARPAARAGGDGVAPRRPRVVVVGDVVLDRDVDGRVDRLCPDAPAPVLDVAAVRESPGGAGLAALLCAASGADVTLVAPVADDEAGRRLAGLLGATVDLLPLPHVGGTRTKTRVRSAGQSLVRVDDGGPGEPGDVLPEDAVRRALAGADAVLVSDYGAGTTRDPRLRALLAEATRRGRTVWDPHPRGGDPLPGTTLVTPNTAEAHGALARATEAPRTTAPPTTAPPAPGPASPGSASAARGLGAPGATSTTPVSPDAPPDVLARALCDLWAARGVVVTAGATGAFLAGGGDARFVPAPAAPHGDPCGAGDRFAASATVALARGAVLSEAVGTAVRDASAWVAAGGAEGYRVRREASGATAAAGPVEGAPSGPARVDAPATGTDRSGTAVPDPLVALAARLRVGGGTLVATGGCFDLVHAGHVATLQAARRLGDALVVVMNADDSVRRLKGPDRPVVGAPDRARVLEALDCVDAVVVFDEDDPRAVLDRLRPDVWVKGGDYGGTRLPEADVVEAHGGRVVLLPYLDGRSTTSMIERTGASRARTPRGAA